MDDTPASGGQSPSGLAQNQTDIQPVPPQQAGSSPPQMPPLQNDLSSPLPLDSQPSTTPASGENLSTSLGSARSDNPPAESAGENILNQSPLASSLQQPVSSVPVLGGESSAAPLQPPSSTAQDPIGSSSFGSGSSTMPPSFPEPVPMDHPFMESSAAPLPPLAPPPQALDGGIPPVPPPPPPSGEVSLTGESGNGLAYNDKQSWYKSKVIISMGVILLAAGLVVGGLYFLQNRGSSSDVVTEEPPQVQPEALPVAFALIVDSPKNGEVSDTSVIPFSGKSTPNSVIVAISDAGQSSVEVDATGTFSETIDLAPGLNELTVLAVSEKGEQKQEKRYVIYDQQ